MKKLMIIVGTCVVAQIAMSAVVDDKTLWMLTADTNKQFVVCCFDSRTFPNRNIAESGKKLLIGVPVSLWGPKLVELKTTLNKLRNGTIRANSANFQAWRNRLADARIRIVVVGFAESQEEVLISFGMETVNKGPGT